MRRLLAQLLMLLMLTPGMACGMALCAGEAAAAPTLSEMPCHAGTAQKQGMSGGVMLMKDCAKADLLQADSSSLTKSDVGKLLFADLGYTALKHSFAEYAPQGIRGPPPGWPGISETTPPILLTTQRFRE